MDASVKITSIRDQTGIDPKTLQVSTNKVITYNVAGHGPFNLVLSADQFTPEAVNAGVEKTVATLRALGQITP